MLSKRMFRLCLVLFAVLHFQFSLAAEFEPFLLSDIWAGSTSSLPVNLTEVDGEVFFTADDGFSGKELHASDGTVSGTRVVKDGFVFTPTNLTSIGSKLIFRADGDLWVMRWIPRLTASMCQNEVSKKHFI